MSLSMDPSINLPESLMKNPELGFVWTNTTDHGMQPPTYDFNLMCWQTLSTHGSDTLDFNAVFHFP